MSSPSVAYPAAIPLSAYVLLLAVAGLLLSLSYWQWQRADEKARWLSLRAENQQAGMLDWAAGRQAEASQDGQQITLKGRFLAEHVVAWDNQMRSAQAGVEVHMAFQPEGSNEAVLVSLGWLPTDRDGGPAIDVTAPALSTIHGRLYFPTQGFVLGEPEYTRGVWRAGVINPAHWAAQWSLPLMPWVLRLDAAGAGPWQQNWHITQRTISPERHQGYAFQWLALAIAWCACWWAFWRRHQREGNMPHD